MALTVDHGLRPEAAAEAIQVGGWLAQHGIRHEVLRWTGSKPVAGIQEAARIARYRLLIDWCCGTGVLHLLLGHHAGDQVETVLYRLLRGSGIAGLAGMAPLLRTRELQLLRPLLAEQPTTLRRWLDAQGQSWIDDPSNRDPRYARNRLRVLLPALAESGLTVAALDRAMVRMAEARAAMDDAVAALVARSCRLHPAGYVCVTRATLMAAAPEVAAQTLARLVTAVGGGCRRCDQEQARRTLAALSDGKAVSTTFGRCRLLAQRETVLVCRETRRLPTPVHIEAGTRLLWDGRFRIAAWYADGAMMRNDAAPGKRARLTLRPVAARDVRILQETVGKNWTALPPAVRLTLPVLEDDAGLLAAPVVGWQRLQTVPSLVVEALWSPRLGTAGGGYFLIEGSSHIFASTCR